MSTSSQESPLETHEQLVATDATATLKVAADDKATDVGGKVLSAADKGAVPAAVHIDLSDEALHWEASPGFKGGSAGQQRPCSAPARSVLSTLRAHPTTWAVPLLLFGLVLGLGVFGVVYGAQKEAQQRR
jgi:hypothetical protein